MDSCEENRRKSLIIPQYVDWHGLHTIPANSDEFQVNAGQLMGGFITNYFFVNTHL